MSLRAFLTAFTSAPLISQLDSAHDCTFCNLGLLHRGLRVRHTHLRVFASASFRLESGNRDGRKQHSRYALGLLQAW